MAMHRRLVRAVLPHRTIDYRKRDADDLVVGLWVCGFVGRSTAIKPPEGRSMMDSMAGQWPQDDSFVKQPGDAFASIATVPRRMVPYRQDK